MGINPKILDKLLIECQEDPENRKVIQEFLIMANDKMPNLKEEYARVIENVVKESGLNED